MKKRVLLAMFVTLALILTAVAGCDEDEVTNPTEPVVDPADSAFVTELFNEEMFMTVFQSMEVSLALLDSIPDVGMRKTAAPMNAFRSDGDSTEHTITAIISYDYSNGWHIFEFEATIVDLTEDDTVDIAGIDSVQVLENGEPVEYPTEQTEMDGLKERVHVDWDRRSDTDHGDLNHVVDIVLDSVEVDTIVTVNGTVHDTLLMSELWDSATCELEVSFDQTVTDLQINVTGDEECPRDGQIVVMASLDVECIGGSGSDFDSLSISGTWTVTATVNDDNTVTITYTDGTVSWTVTEQCNGSSSATPGRWSRVGQF